MEQDKCASCGCVFTRPAEDTLSAEVARLTAERDEYRDALIDIHNCWMVELVDAKPETHAAIDKAIGA